MKFINRIIPLLATLVVFVLFEQLLKTPKQIYWLSGFTFLVVILSVWQLNNRQLKNGKFWYLVITPVLFLAGGLIFLSFLEGRFFKQFFLVVFAVLIWAFLEVVFLKFHLRAKYQTHSLENISTHLNLITIFLIASGFFSLIVFLGISTSLLIIIFAIVNTLLVYQLIKLSDVSLVVGWPYILATVVVITEIFWAVSFLPTSVYVNGLIVTIIYYLITGLTRNWLLGVREGKVVKRYLLISVISLVIVLLSAKWF